MKLRLALLLGAAAFAFTTFSATAQDTAMKGQLASYIPLIAAEGQANAFADYLTSAAKIVATTEPGTAYWFGLRGPQNTLAIFDVFADETARQAHFNGEVAASIKQNASTWVAGGWDAGVLPNVNNATILSARAPINLTTATTATFIALKAKPGQGSKLAELLSAGGKIIAETEPGTVFWVGLQFDDENFAIFDAFANEKGRAAHFAGKVAALLNEKAEELVEGGWESGVVANVRNFDILAMK